MYKRLHLYCVKKIKKEKTVRITDYAREGLHSSERKTQEKVRFRPTELGAESCLLNMTLESFKTTNPCKEFKNQSTPDYILSLKYLMPDKHRFRFDFAASYN